MRAKVTQEGINRNIAFHRWAEERGYFPHSKYHEAFIAGATWRDAKEHPKYESACGNCSCDTRCLML